MSDRLSPAERIALWGASFDEQDAGLRGSDPLRFPGYAQALPAKGEALVWGWARLEGLDFALVCFDFSFLGGSMGLAVGEKVARAFDAARERSLPVVAVTASGGARMQEGMVSLVQMAKTVEARRRHAEAGGAQVTVLTSPTTGGVYASFASLGDVILAEPGSLVGFAGPRVVKELTGDEAPSDVHRAEYAHAHGQVDEIVPRPEQPGTIARVLRNLTGRRAAPEPAEWDEPQPAEPPSAWDRVRLSRDPARPKAPDVLDALLADAVTLRGDRQGGGDDPGVLVRLGALRPSGRRVVAVAQHAAGDGRIRPPGYRKAIRALELAGRLGLPVVSVIDTRGADPLPDSEAGGVAAAIARTFAATLACPSPTLALVTGEGGSGGALATAVCDRIVIWEHAIFSVIAPEGAASILHRDGSRAPELAERLRLTAPDLVELGIADEVAPEPPGGAQADPRGALGRLAGLAADSVETLLGEEATSRLARRRDRWRAAGNRFLT